MRLSSTLGPVNLALTDDQQFFQETTRKFLEQEAPIAAVRALADTADGFDRAWWARGAELGWTSLLVPEADGGGSLSGAALLDLVIVAEEMGRLVSPGPLAPTNVVAAAVADGGAPELRARVLPGIVSGEVVGAWCIAGPGGGWDADGVAVTATRDGDDFVLDGIATRSKPARRPTSCSSPRAPAAGPGTQACPSSSSPPAPPASRSRRSTRRLVRRFAAVRFDGVRVPAANVVGEVDAAAEAVERQLQLAIVLQCAETVGAARPGRRVHPRVPGRPQLVRPAVGVLPGDQAPVRRHEDVVGSPRTASPSSQRARCRTPIPRHPRS